MGGHKEGMTFEGGGSSCLSLSTATPPSIIRGDFANAVGYPGGGREVFFYSAIRRIWKVATGVVSPPDSGADEGVKFGFSPNKEMVSTG